MSNKAFGLCTIFILAMEIGNETSRGSETDTNSPCPHHLHLPALSVTSDEFHKADIKQTNQTSGTSVSMTSTSAKAGTNRVSKEWHLKDLTSDLSRRNTDLSCIFKKRGDTFTVGLMEFHLIDRVVSFGDSPIHTTVRNHCCETEWSGFLGYKHFNLMMKNSTHEVALFCTIKFP